jgi:hypothetical protein
MERGALVLLSVVAAAIALVAVVAIPVLTTGRGGATSGGDAESISAVSWRFTDCWNLTSVTGPGHEPEGVPFGVSVSLTGPPSGTCQITDLEIASWPAANLLWSEVYLRGTDLPLKVGPGATATLSAELEFGEIPAEVNGLLTLNVTVD